MLEPRLDRIAVVLSGAVASAAFPFAFAPAHLTGIGDFVDGGVVNNTPIKYAIDRNDPQ